MVHIRFDGRSMDVREDVLALRIGMTDREIRERTARYLDIRVEGLDGYVIDRAPSGAVIIRPEAVYG
jgi:hypothetical protein